MVKVADPVVGVGVWVSFGDIGVCVDSGNFVFVSIGFVIVGAVVSLGAGIFVLVGGLGVLLGLDKVGVVFWNSAGFTFDVGGTLVDVFASVGVAGSSLMGARSDEKQQHVIAMISREPQPLINAQRGPPT